jgi:hypothetical protein
MNITLDEFESMKKYINWNEYLKVYKMPTMNYNMTITNDKDDTVIEKKMVSRDLDEMFTVEIKSQPSPKK